MKLLGLMPMSHHQHPMQVNHIDIGGRFNIKVQLDVGTGQVVRRQHKLLGISGEARDRAIVERRLRLVNQSRRDGIAKPGQVRQLARVGAGQIGDRH